MDFVGLALPNVLEIYNVFDNAFYLLQCYDVWQCQTYSTSFFMSICNVIVY
jgi:hypothetical protein